MFSLNDLMRYYLCPGATDMRKSFYSLSGVVKDNMKQDIRRSKGKAVRIAQNSYDNTGRLASVRRNSTNALLTQYSYNVRSWITGIDSLAYQSCFRIFNC